MENSPFNGLSAELRNRIWEYAVTSDNDALQVGTTAAKQPAITRVCTQIRDEALLMFYANNNFKINLRTLLVACDRLEQPLRSAPVMIKWLCELDHSVHTSVKSLTFVLDKLQVGRKPNELMSNPECGEIALLLKKCGYTESRLRIEVLSNLPKSRPIHHKVYYASKLEWAMVLQGVLRTKGFKVDIETKKIVVDD